MADGFILQQLLQSGIGKSGGMLDGGVLGAEMFGGVEDLGGGGRCE
jgi:hypothetical protein